MNDVVSFEYLGPRLYLPSAVESYYQRRSAVKQKCKQSGMSLKQFSLHNKQNLIYRVTILVQRGFL